MVMKVGKYFSLFNKLVNKLKSNKVKKKIHLTFISKYRDLPVCKTSLKTANTCFLNMLIMYNMVE